LCYSIEHGIEVSVSSPPITLLNFPNKIVGSMEQVTNEIAEAVEFILRYGMRLGYSVPGVL